MRITFRSMILIAFANFCIPLYSGVFRRRSASFRVVLLSFRCRSVVVPRRSASFRAPNFPFLVFSQVELKNHSVFMIFNYFQKLSLFSLIFIFFND